MYFYRIRLKGLLATGRTEIVNLTLVLGVRRSPGLPDSAKHSFIYGLHFETQPAEANDTHALTWGQPFSLGD